jgi:hypothetical protein
MLHIAFYDLPSLWQPKNGGAFQIFQHCGTSKLRDGGTNLDIWFRLFPGRNLKLRLESRWQIMTFVNCKKPLCVSELYKVVGFQREPRPESLS